LPSARQTALGKDLFADGNFPEGSLPRAAFGKAFAEGLIAFAEGRRPSAKILSAVVRGPIVPPALPLVLPFPALVLLAVTTLCAAHYRLAKGAMKEKGRERRG